MFLQRNSDVEKTSGEEKQKWGLAISRGAVLKPVHAGEFYVGSITVGINSSN
jgi:hypothetical protein